MQHPNEKPQAMEGIKLYTWIVVLIVVTVAWGIAGYVVLR